jgi:hypothetical protein
LGATATTEKAAPKGLRMDLKHSADGERRHSTQTFFPVHKLNFHGLPFFLGS